MDPVPYQLPGAVATYSAKSALFTAGLADRGTFFDNTGSYTISLDAAATLGAGWSAWFRCVSGTQVLDPNGAELINGAATYSVSNAGDVVLVECTGTAFVISQSQLPAGVKLTGGTIVGVTLSGCSLFGATITGSTIQGGTISGTTISNTTLSGSTFLAGTISGSTFLGGTLSGSTFIGGTLSGTTIVNPTITGGTMNNTPIGATTKATGAFTTLTVTGVSSLGTISTGFAGNILAGVQDGTAFVAGQVGEEIESTISTPQNAAGTGTYLALTSITLTPGDWDISATAEFSCNASTTSGAAQINIGTTSGSGAGTTEPYDLVQIPAGLMSGGQVWPMSITRKRVSITTSTTYYLNVLGRFSLGTPQWYGTIAARRLR